MIFNSILIANRGEIACRIIQTAHEMGVRCVAVYVDDDRESPYVKMADQSVRLPDGGYLDGKEIKRSEFEDIKNQVTDVDKKLWYEQVKKEMEEIGRRVK